jgi:AcrR family transcriptional regulator
VDPDDALLGVRAPQQARSRKTLQKLMDAAEEEIAGVGAEDATMTGVAGRAGVSVGTLYRRFEGKDQLLRAVKERVLARLEEGLAETLAAAGPDLAGVVEAYTQGIARWAAQSGALLPELTGIRGGRPTSQHSGLADLQRLFAGIAQAHHDEVRRPEPEIALAFVARTITAAAVHRALTATTVPDGMTWPSWQRETADMALAYLTGA